MTRFVELLSDKERRDGRRYKQKEIAEAAGVSETTVSRWMKGDNLSSATLETAEKLAAFLECEIGDLVKRKPELA